jgi:hypothetical protein
MCRTSPDLSTNVTVRDSGSDAEHLRIYVPTGLPASKLVASALVRNKEPQYMGSRGGASRSLPSLNKDIAASKPEDGEPPAGTRGLAGDVAAVEVEGAGNEANGMGSTDLAGAISKGWLVPVGT